MGSMEKPPLSPLHSKQPSATLHCRHKRSPRAPGFLEHKAAQDAEAQYYEKTISQVLFT